MWLGEQIDEYGLGNGISLIIMAGIVARMPTALFQLVTQVSFSAQGGMGPDFHGQAGIPAGGVRVCGRRSDSDYPGPAAHTDPAGKHTRGRRIYGGQKQYLPLRVNHGGVMPIIFAQSLMLFPLMIVGYFASSFPKPVSFASSTTSLDVARSCMSLRKLP